MFGGIGRDILGAVGPGRDLNDGGDGVDVIIAGSRNEAPITVDLTQEIAVIGSSAQEPITDFEEVWLGIAGQATIIGNEEDNVFAHMGFGDDDTPPNFLEGRGGNDHISTQAGPDRIEGGAGNDVLSANGDDTVYGGEGDDEISDTGSGSASLFGDAGNDVFIFHSKGLLDDDDAADGGAGRDVADYHDVFASGMAIDLSAGTATGNGADRLTMIEDVIGSRLGDVITGDDNANSLQGLGGDDDISGLGGDDALDGGEGIDDLDGGDGTDSCVNGETEQECES
jgi:Ca2+-binding RTX toxin-like protein